MPFLILLSAFSQGKQERTLYVYSPNPEDKLCISAVEKAKKDVSNRKIVFTQRAGLGFVYCEKVTG